MVALGIFSVTIFSKVHNVYIANLVNLNVDYL